MRSYETKRKHQSYTITKNGEVIPTEFYDGLAPSEFFIRQLSNPTNVIRSKVFKKKGILKLNDWRNNYQKWINLGYFPGDSIEKVGLLREFSISQFTYCSIKQYLAIEKEVQSNKRKYNQSYEGYYINNDGTLNYQQMIIDIDDIINSGSLSINKELDKNRHRVRDLNVIHSESEVYQVIKASVNNVEIPDTEKNMVDETIEFDTDLSDIDW